MFTECCLASLCALGGEFLHTLEMMRLAGVKGQSISGFGEGGSLAVVAAVLAGLASSNDDLWGSCLHRN